MCQETSKTRGRVKSQDFFGSRGSTEAQDTWVLSVMPIICRGIEAVMNTLHQQARIARGRH